MRIRFEALEVPADRLLPGPVCWGAVVRGRILELRTGRRRLLGRDLGDPAFGRGRADEVLPALESAAETGSGVVGSGASAR